MTSDNRRRKFQGASVRGPYTLDDLRWLVDQCEGLPPNTRVSVIAASGEQRDYDPGKITVGDDPL